MTLKQTPLLDLWTVSAETTPPDESGKRVSLEAYWAEYYHHEHNYEWNNGILETKPVSDYLNILAYRWLYGVLTAFLEVNPIAKITMLEFGFKTPTSVRKPDLGLVLNSNPVPLRDRDMSYKGTYDLCIEALSDSQPKEIRRDTVEKYQEYELAGVREYYIIDEKGREMSFWRNVNGVYQPILPVNGVIHSTVLPNFQFRVADLYRRPSLLELSEDAIYQAFILPEYQQAQRRIVDLLREREAAQQQAEQERRERKAAQQQLLDTARNLLPRLDDAAISQATGLSTETIRQLREAAA